MTLTTEQLRNLMEFNGPDHDSTSANADAWEVNEMAAELLANREAQPVAEPYMYELWKWDETVPELDRWFLVERSHEKLVAGKEQKVVILYTAPPAPAVVNGRTAEGWMAEALLQKNVAEALRKSFPAVSEGECYKFPGRWIDCTDALPQNGENIITLNNIGGVYGGYIFKRYENGGWDFVDAEEEFRVGDGITHWMPLPAAPEGGN